MNAGPAIVSIHHILERSRPRQILGLLVPDPAHTRKRKHTAQKATNTQLRTPILKHMGVVDVGRVRERKLLGTKRGCLFDDYMKFDPRPWQAKMIPFVVEHKRANLWCEMGGGKTSVVLTALELLQLIEDSFPALILAPLRVARDVWPAELHKWDHLKKLSISAITGSAPERLRALHRKADIYSMNYENIPWLVEALAESPWPFKIVIADESTRLKGFRLRAGTKRAAALATVAKKTERWLNLTGTPAPNGLKDLWGQNWFLDFGERLGKTHTAFKQRWFDYDQYTMELSPKKHAGEQIYKALSDCTLSIQMKDWIDLRKPIITPVSVTLPSEAMKQYKKLEKEMYVALSEEIELTAMSAAAKSTKCLQFCAGAVYYEDDKWTEIHSAKLDALESIIEETSGANLLVSYWWRHDAERIRKRFKRARVFRTKQDADDWNEGRIQLLLAHPQSAGHGLNLQYGGHHIVFFTDWWNLEYKSQIIERIGPVRQIQAGFDRPVYIYEILASGTIDELVAERHRSKATVQELLMKAMRHV